MREKNELLDETTWRIIREAKGIAGWVAVSAVLGILAVLCSIAAPEILGDLIQKLYDFGLSDRQTPIRDSLVGGLLLLTAVYAAQGVFRYLNMQLMNRTVSRHFTCDLRIAISDKIRRLPVKYVDQTPVGDVLNRMIDDVSAMGNYIHQVFDVMVEGVFQITMIAVAMFLKNWVLACLVIVLTPISLWISSKIAGASGKYYDEWFKKSGELTEIVEESFTNFATAKAYNLEEYTVQKHAVVNEQLRKAGGEYGAATGRPRRVGWFDCVATRYGCEMQGATEVAMTNLDVLGYLDEIPVCVAYELNGERVDHFPVTPKLEQCKPIYVKLPGWKCDTRGIKNFDELPENARHYIEFLEKEVGCPFKLISNGPRRDEIIYR